MWGFGNHSWSGWFTMILLWNLKMTRNDLVEVRDVESYKMNVESVKINYFPPWSFSLNALTKKVSDKVLMAHEWISCYY